MFNVWLLLFVGFPILGVLALAFLFVRQVRYVWRDEDWTKGKTRCDVNFVMRNCRVGDLILFQGNKFIRFTSPITTWSHVGVIIKDQHGRLAISEAYRTTIDLDVIRGTRHSGVQTVALRKRLEVVEITEPVVAPPDPLRQRPPRRRTAMVTIVSPIASPAYSATNVAIATPETARPSPTTKTKSRAMFRPLMTT